MVQCDCFLIFLSRYLYSLASVKLPEPCSLLPPRHSAIAGAALKRISHLRSGILPETKAVCVSQSDPESSILMEFLRFRHEGNNVVEFDPN